MGNPFSILNQTKTVDNNFPSFSFLIREAERQAREEVNTLKESIEVAKVRAESDTSSASMMIAK